MDFEASYSSTIGVGVGRSKTDFRLLRLKLNALSIQIFNAISTLLSHFFDAKVNSSIHNLKAT